ncbi:MAG: hypothetical protein O3B70_05890 [Bacteroidetes bacterium]|nr:hypothetical protein [Bacteroidota bacterium]MDA0903850.1 hypothetical protein [Bacteroidota bacterium]
MPNTSPDLAGPRLVILDMLGALVAHDDSVRGAISAAFQAHGESVDPELASMALGYPGIEGIVRIVRWLHPQEEPHVQSCQSIHDLAVKELARLVRFGGGIHVVGGVENMCQTWIASGRRVAASTTLHPDIVKPLMARMGWDVHPPFEALVLAEEVQDPTPGPGLILECMRRTGVLDVGEVAKVANNAVGLSDAKRLQCGWTVLLDSGILSTDQVAAFSPSAIVDQFSDLGMLWKIPRRDDTLDREIEDMLHRAKARD